MRSNIKITSKEKSKMHSEKSVTNSKKDKTNNEKGVTLIALVITIVILIILATVSINMLVGENRINKPSDKSKAGYSNRRSKSTKCI